MSPRLKILFGLLVAAIFWLSWESGIGMDLSQSSSAAGDAAQLRSPWREGEIQGPVALRDLARKQPRGWGREAELFEARCRVLRSGPASQRHALAERLVQESELPLLRYLLEDEEALARLPEDVFRMMLRRLAGADAPWTGDYLQFMLAGSFRAELTGTAMARWAETDLPGALKWAANCAEAELRSEALVHLSYRWFETDPAEALAYAMLEPLGNRQMLANLVGLWARSEPAQAVSWATEFLSEPDLVGVAVNAVATWAQQDELAAVEFVIGLPAGPLRREAAVSLMSALAVNDPALGALWAEAFPAGPDKNYAIENLVYKWAANDPSAAFAWVNRLPSAERDLAIFAGAGGLIETSPAVAAGWVAAIQDEARRVRQSERVAVRWLQSDRWAAEAWVRNSTLPDGVKKRVLAAVPGGS